VEEHLRRVEEKESTFKPNIDKKSKFLTSNREYIPPEDRLIMHGKL
jgi:hypothetical protein